MIKFFLLGIGLIFLFEGLVYFFFLEKIRMMLKIINTLDNNQIKSISSFMILFGACLIYFTIKVYQF